MDDENSEGVFGEDANSKHRRTAAAKVLAVLLASKQHNFRALPRNKRKRARNKLGNRRHVDQLLREGISVMNCSSGSIA